MCVEPCMPQVVSRFSTVAARSKEVSCELDLVSFIRATSDCAEGPYHCWINRFEGGSEFLQKDRAYLLLAESFLDDPPGSRGDRIVMLQKVKLLQQRYPWLHVFGFQSCSSISSEVDRSLLMDEIMDEYITFPILLCSKNFPEVASGACCILLNGLKSPPLYNQNDVDLCILHKAIKDLNKQLVQNAGNAGKLRCSWSKKTEGFKEPYICSYLQNLPLSLPACISADEHGNRFFLSDSNHHRVIVFDNTGKILDAIGSSPGYDDGDFEIAKLMRPAASWYHASEDCLYLVDSENHAIRRADLGKRVLETLYPSCADNGRSGLWSWILDKLGFCGEAGMKSVELDQATLLFPWHLLKSKDNDLLVMNRSLETLWIVDLDSGKVRDVVKGHEEVMEFCGKQIMEKVSDLQGLSSDILQQLFNSSHTLGGTQNSHFDFLSSFVTTGEDQLICDTVGQRVLMLNKQAEVASSVEFSNFGILGLPYWLSYSLERVFPYGHTWEEATFDHLQSYSLLPGKIDVHMAVSIPDNTELIEPLQEHCVWRQVRGAAMEVLKMETTAETSDKTRFPFLDMLQVGAAQKWYDDLDNLAFETEPEESKEEIRPGVDFQDGKIHIDCVVKTSPGTSEVVISAPLYLKLRSSCKTHGKSRDMKAAEIADILKPQRNGRLERDTFIRLLLKMNRDLGDLVFIKPLHVKMTFDTPNLPKTENSRDIILTDATVDVNVVL
ncbi:uncharacterized protein LOC141653394 isoform X2 [Silene latifolia]|uniref:uncharacterized protein LOC141653394 isoform X2 n=1 Tax=Silene latifolia TaxID=37657 RepID=UPI003D76F332